MDAKDIATLVSIGTCALIAFISSQRKMSFKEFERRERSITARFSAMEGKWIAAEKREADLRVKYGVLELEKTMMVSQLKSLREKYEALRKMIVDKHGECPTPGVCPIFKELGHD